MKVRENDNIILCDSCMKIVAESPCAICGDALCSRCAIPTKMILQSRLSYIEVLSLPVCRKCTLAVRNFDKKDNRQAIEHIQETIVGEIRNFTVVNALEGDDKKGGKL